MNFSRVVTGLVLLTGLTAIHAVSDRIYNGEPSIRGQFPYQVAIKTYDGGVHTFFCGGSILSSRWVLTAAHCVLPANGTASHIKLRVGSVKWWRGHSYHVEKYIVHEKYGKHDFDIALIKTKKPIKFSNFVESIPISYSFVDGGHNVTISGWGNINEDGDMADILQFATLKSISDEDCKKYNNYKEVLTSNMVCTIGTNNITACSGDSGGPLVMKGQLVGIASFVLKSETEDVCESNYPNVFVRVSSLVDWIDKQIKEN